MSTRTSTGASLLPGLMAPRKHDELRIDYTTRDKTNFGYFSGGIFLSRVEITYDKTGREINHKLYNDEGPFNA